MEKYKEILGNLITLSKTGEFDVIAHGVNCFSTMKAGIAVDMAKEFKCDTFDLECSYDKGDINKLGQIDYNTVYIRENGSTFTDIEGHYSAIYSFQDNLKSFVVVNAYTQYNYSNNHTGGVSKPLDYEALTICMRKINHIFKGKHIGLPQIGAGLAGGSWHRIKEIIKTELKDCTVTVVIFKK